METIALISVIMIGISYELFCTFCVLCYLAKVNDNFGTVICKFIIAALFGWIIVPSALGISEGIKMYLKSK